MKRKISEVVAIIREVDMARGTDLSCLEVKHNGRLTRALGRCNYNRFTSEATSLEFSTITMNMEYEPFRQVVLHEVAHAIQMTEQGETGHGKNFKQICKEIGCSIDGTKTAYGVEEATQVSAKYVVTCNDCGNRSYFQRRSKAINVLTGHIKGKCTCGKCGSQDLNLECR